MTLTLILKVKLRFDLIFEFLVSRSISTPSFIKIFNKKGEKNNNNNNNKKRSKINSIHRRVNANNTKPLDKLKSGPDLKHSPNRPTDEKN